jgi:hypothetical protein
MIPNQNHHEVSGSLRFAELDFAIVAALQRRNDSRLEAPFLDTLAVRGPFIQH